MTLSSVDADMAWEDMPGEDADVPPLAESADADSDVSPPTGPSTIGRVIGTELSDRSLESEDGVAALSSLTCELSLLD